MNRLINDRFLRYNDGADGLWFNESHNSNDLKIADAPVKIENEITPDGNSHQSQDDQTTR